MDNIALKGSNQVLIRLDRIEMALNRMIKMVEGNGKTGLCDKVDAMERCMESVSKANLVARLDVIETSVEQHAESERERLHNQKEAEKERKEFWNKVTLIVITMVITNAGVIIMGLLK